MLKASLLFGTDDQAALRAGGEILADQIDDILDVWYGFVSSHPHLIAYFSTPAGTPLPDYDERWLAYQHEIALRHTSATKNSTDGADSVAAADRPVGAALRGLGLVSRKVRRSRRSTPT